MHVTFCPSYTAAGRKYELVCVSESVSSSLCGSSSEFSTNEISVSGLPPDERQETTQNSLPPLCTISALMDTFGVAVQQKKNITHSHKLMSLPANLKVRSRTEALFDFSFFFFFLEQKAKTG